VSLSPEFIQELLRGEQQKHIPQPDAFYRHGFDRNCLFLLDLQYENLFEPWISKFERIDNAYWFMCKGCGRKVKRTGRESHHEWHKRELVAK